MPYPKASAFGPIEALPKDCVVKAHEGPLLYVFVSCGDPVSERRLEEIPEPRRLLPVVVCIDDEPDAAWLARHARGFPTITRGAAAVERIGGVPTAVIAGPSGVVALDPDAAEIERLNR